MKKVALFLLIIVLLNVLRPSLGYAADNKKAELEFKCINVSNPDKPINVGDTFDIKIIGKEIDDLYGYSVNFLYDPGLISVADSVYRSVAQDVYTEFFSLSSDESDVSVSDNVYGNETVAESVYMPYIHPSVFDGLETFRINTIYKGSVGSRKNGISLDGLENASFTEFLKGQKEGIGVRDCVIAKISFKALKEGSMPLVPSNELADIKSGASIVIQMANSSVGDNEKIPYKIKLSYGELIIGEGEHTPPKTYSFLYPEKQALLKNKNRKRRENKSSSVNVQSNKAGRLNYDLIWDSSAGESETVELKKTLQVVRKRKQGFPKIEYRLDEEEVAKAIEDFGNGKREIVLSIPSNGEYESDNISFAVPLNILTKVKKSSKKVILRCSTDFSSGQINLSELDFDLAVSKLGKNIKTQFVNFVFGISKAPAAEIDVDEIENSQAVLDGIYINAFMKYGRKKQLLLNLGRWCELVVPYKLYEHQNDMHIMCLVMQNEDSVIIPAKVINKEGQKFIKIKTMCPNGAFYPVLSDQIKKPEIGMDKYNPPAMEELIQRRVFKGYPDGKLYGNRFLTRSQCIVLLYRIFGMVSEDSTGSDFKDIESGIWYSAEIEQARSLGWIEGYPDGTFRPNNMITQGEVSLVIKKILDWNAEKKYSDKFMPVEAWEKVRELSYKHKVLQYLFRKREALITRNQFALVLKILENVLGLE